MKNNFAQGNFNVPQNISTSLNGTNGTIQVKNLTARYNEQIVLNNISFELKQNSFTALCGANGVGKSTLLSLLDGIIPAGLKVSGEIFVNGKSVFKTKRDELAKNISYLVQKENPVWNMNVKDFIETGLYSFWQMSKYDCNTAIINVAKTLGIEHLLHKNIFNISGGEFQKCRLARCMVQNCKILLFDEPSENLDLTFQMKFLKLIKETHKQQTVLISIHDINTAAMFADNFILVSKGCVICGSSEEIFNEKVLSQAYNSQVKIFTHSILGVRQALM